MNHRQFEIEFQSTFNKGNRPLRVQKVFSSPDTLSFEVRIPGKTLNIYFGRGHNRQFIKILKEKMPKELRIKDKFLEFLRSKISQKIITEIFVPKDVRGIGFKYQGEVGAEVLIIFYWGEESYFFFSEEVVEKGKIFWRSRLSKNWSHKDISFEDEGWKKSWLKFLTEFSKRDKYFFIEDTLIEEAEFKKNLQQNKEDFLNRDNAKKIKFLERKLEKISNDQLNIQKIDKLVKLADDYIFLENAEDAILGIKFPLRKNAPIFEKRNWIFNKIKKLKRGREIVLERLLQTEKELELVRSGGSLKDAPKARVGVNIVSPVWETADKGNEKKPENEGKFEVFNLPSGVEYCWGKNVQQNIDLRKNWAKSSDWWCHDSDSSGPHVFIRTPKESMPSIEDLVKIFRNVYSGREDMRQLDIIITMVKNIRAVKGSPGHIRFNKEKRVRIILDSRS